MITPSIRLILAAGLWAALAGSAATPPLTTPQERQSYSLGVDLARNFRRQGVELNLDLLIQGLKDGFSGEKLLMSEAELRDTLTILQGEIRQRQAQFRGRGPGEINRRTGEAFLAKNRNQPGIISLPSGLEYKILKEGKGPKPTATSTVSFNYRSTRLDGTEFVCSNPGEPATFKLQEVIPGWKEALLLMPVGSKWKLFIPPNLAYGTQGVGRTVGPNETVISELELVAIK